MRRLASVLAVLVPVAAAIALAGAGGEGGGPKAYDVEFDNAFGLTEGGDLKVGGVRAGQTTDFRLTDSEPPKAVARIEITEPGFDSFRTDASCEVRQQSLIGEYFVDCQPGEASEELPAGGTIPVERTSSPVNQDLVNNILRRPYRERLRLIVAELGAGLAGRPDDLREVLRRAHPGLRETTETLRVLARQNRIIKDFIRDSDTVLEQLERRKRDVARFVEEAGETAEISATRRDALALQFRRLPTFLDELEPTMARLGEVADEQTPLLRDLRAAAPDVNELFTRLGPFSEATLPALRSLGRAARTGREALRESSQEIEELRTLSEDAPELAEPLRQFLQTAGDRSRSTETDPRVRETVPPAPDPNSDPDEGNGGFTALESLLNWLYFNTLAVNSFDEVGHQLREILFANPCLSYDPQPSEELQDQCGSYYGPYQPGLDPEDPDPTEDVAAAERRERANPDAARPRRRRAAGEPEAPPLPGRPDISRPQIVLPPGLDELLNELPDLLEDAPPASGDRGAETLFDFLLAP